MKKYLFSVAVVLGLLTCGCSTAPETSSGKEQLRNDAEAILKDFESEDSSLQNFLDDGYGYAIFPSVGKEAAGVGGGWGRGEVYEKGKLVGYCDITEWSLGASLGGQSQSELIVFQNRFAIDQFEEGDYTFGAQASAIAMEAGAVAQVKYQDGVAIFVMARGGLMADASVGGEKFNFEPIQ